MNFKSSFPFTFYAHKFENTVSKIPKNLIYVSRLAKVFERLS